MRKNIFNSQRPLGTRLPVKSIKNLNTFSPTLNCVKMYDTNK